MPIDLEDVEAGVHPGVPRVLCPDTNKTGVPPNANPTRFGERTVVVMSQPDPETGAMTAGFSLKISGPNDPDLVAATAKFAHIADPRERTHVIYAEAARMKQAHQSANGHRRGTNPIPVINDVAARPDHTAENQLPPHQPQPQPPPPPPPQLQAVPAEAQPPAPLVRVEFLLADGGVIEVDYADAVISGDTLALVETPGPSRGTYTPPKSDGESLREVCMRITGLADSYGLLTAYRLQDAYTVGGRRHLVFMIDRATS